MAMTLALQDFLSKKGVAFETVLHHHSDSAFNVAQAAHIPAERLVKAVLLEDDHDRQLMAIIPANKKLLVKAVSDMAYGHFHNVWICLRSTLGLIPNELQGKSVKHCLYHLGYSWSFCNETKLQTFDKMTTEALYFSRIA